MSSVVSATRVLVVEDEPDVALLIKDTLERSSAISVDVASSGDAALRAVAEEAPDLIVLDLSLPVVSGIEVCRILRQRAATASIPILIVSARSAEADKVTGLDVGADDYLAKPFGLRELSARVRALLRRRADGPARVGGFVYEGAHLLADFDAVAVTVDRERVRLTRREFDLLRHLVENKNRVVSRERLLERVWKYDQMVETRSVDVHVARLRSKLGQAGRQIETVVGLGYRFVD
jgi:DNA-binding response OmpR family regulator